MGVRNLTLIELINETLIERGGFQLIDIPQAGPNEPPPVVVFCAVGEHAEKIKDVILREMNLVPSIAARTDLLENGRFIECVPHAQTGCRICWP